MSDFMCSHSQFSRRVYLTLVFATIFVVPVTYAQTGPAPSAQISSENSAAQNTLPISVAIVVDISSSASSYRDEIDSKYKALFKSLSSFIEEGNAQSEYFIIPFSTEPKSLTTGSSSIAQVLKVMKRLSLSKREGATALYDACYLGASKVAQGKHDKRVVLVFSDGDDNISDKTLGDLQRLLIDTKVLLYAIDMGDPRNSGYIKGAETLEKMASVSGGVALSTKSPEGVKLAFENIKMKLRQ
jgi:VWFA-related protein